MEDLLIEKTRITPSIKFYTNGELRIEGRSIPENSIEFYRTVIAWLIDFRKTKTKKINLHISLDYFNTSSAKYLLVFFKQLKQLKWDGYEIKVYWYYDVNDEDMTEAGQCFEYLIKLPFSYVQLTS